MKKIFTLILVVLAMMVLPALAVNGATSNQDVMQSGSQTAKGAASGGSNINQNLGQAAGQTVQGSGLAGNNVGTGNNTAAEGTVNQNLVQTANQAASSNNLSQVNQGISQEANQSASGLTNNAAINQNLTQRASQAFFGSELNNTGTNQTLPQNGTNQIMPRGNTNQTMPQNNTNLIGTFNEGNFFRTNQMTPLTEQERAMMFNRTGEFATGYSNMGQYVIPLNDLARLANDRTRNLDVIYIDQNAWNRQGRITGANYVPLTALSSQINQLPRDRPIVIVGDNSMDTAIAMTILRMNGYNAWIAGTQTGVSTGTSAGTAAMGTTAAGTTVTGATTGVTTTPGMTNVGTTNAGATNAGATNAGSMVSTMPTNNAVEVVGSPILR